MKLDLQHLVLLMLDFMEKEFIFQQLQFTLYLILEQERIRLLLFHGYSLETSILSSRYRKPKQSFSSFLPSSRWDVLSVLSRWQLGTESLLLFLENGAFLCTWRCKELGRSNLLSRGFPFLTSCPPKLQNSTVFFFSSIHRWQEEFWIDVFFCLASTKYRWFDWSSNQSWL